MKDRKITWLAWRLIEYADFDTVSKKWIHPYGDHPKGYFTYTSSGIVNLNGSAEKPLVISADSEYIKPLTLGAVLDNAFGYFGTCSIDSSNSIVTHHVKGGSVISYIGTDQHRQFILKGDTLLIGDPTFEVGKRILIREDQFQAHVHDIYIGAKYVSDSCIEFHGYMTGDEMKKVQPKDFGHGLCRAMFLEELKSISEFVELCKKGRKVE